MAKIPAKKKQKISEPTPKSKSDKIYQKQTKTRFSLPLKIPPISIDLRATGLDSIGVTGKGKSKKRSRSSFLEIAKKKMNPTTSDIENGEDSQEEEQDEEDEEEEEMEESDTETEGSETGGGSTMELANGISDVNRSEILLKSLKEGAVVGNYREDVEEINKTFTIATKRWKKLMIESLVEGLFPEFLNGIQQLVVNIKESHKRTAAIEGKLARDVEGSEHRFKEVVDRFKELETKLKNVNETWENDINTAQKNCDTAIKLHEKQYQIDLLSLRKDIAHLLKKKD